MSLEKYELITLKFDGPSFRTHGLELDILMELIYFKKIIVEITTELFRRNNPERIRLPKGFNESIIIKFYNIGEGSVTIPLFREVILEENQIPFEFKVKNEINQAIDL